MLKMRAVITLLVLLLSMCGSQTRSTQTEVHTESQSTGAAAAAAVSTQLDVSAELRELRAMVLEMRGQLTVQNELQNTKTLLNKMLIVNYTLSNDYKIYLQMDSPCVFFTPCKAILLHLFFKQRTQILVYSTHALKQGSFLSFFFLTHLNGESVDKQAGSQSKQPVLSKPVVR